MFTIKKSHLNVIHRVREIVTMSHGKREKYIQSSRQVCLSPSVLLEIIANYIYIFLKANIENNIWNTDLS